MKKIIFVLLLILLLLPFSACSKSGKGLDDTADDNQPGIAEADDAEPENQTGYDSLPAIDYGGKDFVIANIVQ